MDVNQERLNSFMGKMIGDVGAAMNASLMLLGDKLGLYQALAKQGPMNASALAKATGTAERYVQEWLSAQAASGYIEYDSKSGKFSMLPEQALALADEDSPVFLGAVGSLVGATFLDEPKITDAFKTGKGVGWNKRNECLFCGTARFFRTSYKHYLVQEWLPALEGVVEKLSKGARVCDVGCGHGASTLIMADAFPKSQFTGIDFHEPSITRARELAANRNNITFTSGRAQEFAGDGFDLVTIFDALHDMGDPVGAGRHVKQALAKDGTWMIVEPMAHDCLKDNLNPVGRIYYGASTMICTPASLAQDVGLGLGAQAGEMKLRKVALDAGFSKFRRATETPFNMVLEVRP